MSLRWAPSQAHAPSAGPPEANGPVMGRPEAHGPRGHCPPLPPPSATLGCGTTQYEVHH